MESSYGLGYTRSALSLLAAVVMFLFPMVGISDPSSQTRVQQPEVRDNQELFRMFNADQSPRSKVDSLSHRALDALEEGDIHRRQRVLTLMAEGKLQTPNDYFYAAMIFQHGNKAEEYLRSHELAIVAAAKGHKVALWLSAASLDRYLQKIGQPQVFGTQFRPDSSGNWTMEPYDRSMSDEMRKTFGVPNLDEQKKQLSKLQHSIRNKQ